MSPNELLAAIRWAREQNLTELKLIGEYLTGLPANIGQLTDLQLLDLNHNILTALPSEIGHLTDLQSLTLSNNNLMTLPSEIGHLTNLHFLSLDSNQLIALPSEFGQLTNLRSLKLDSNQLTALPSEFGQLTNLQVLDLGDNGLGELPVEVGLLANLQSLFLTHNGLTALPSEIGQLTVLQSLFLDVNQLTTLPSEIGQLASLLSLTLDDNQLTTLPSEIGRLTNLQLLVLGSNGLKTLPPQIGQLVNLETLDLRNNGLEALPSQIGQLASLETLDLRNNGLEALPSQIGQLANLETLDLRNNGLKALPSQIGQLTNLETLDLRNNGLKALPTQIGQLTKLRTLILGDNDWAEPWSDLVNGPKKELLAYLRSLAEFPQYEAKVLLVGEGAVGKSTLLRALRNEPFDPELSTTHGIEIKQVEEEHPDSQVDERLILNFWDFGGQEVYRITHQFFFSRHALFLLIWKPREGWKENALEDWLESIHLRVGDDARVLIVATHCNEHIPDLDYPALATKYPRMLAGHLAVDSADGTGIDGLHARIAQIVAEMEYVGTPFNRSWLDTRDALKNMDETHITYDEFVEVCARHGLNEIDAAALISILHTLGHIIFYDTDGLRDFVVLKPEWLTKAIGYVLEDAQTLEGGGILDHQRLAAIWDNPYDPSHERYHAAYFPYFLRLMEQYDVSVRLVEEADCDASLVPQMAPHERPELPWSVAGAKMTMVCEMEQKPPGLVAWTTARNHRWSTNTHWRSGVFFRHEDGHEALVDYARLRRRLSLTVRGEYPAHFMSLLRDGLEKLIGERWPYLDYELFVPCPNHKNGKPCEGQLPLDGLFLARREGMPSIPCYRCMKPVDVGRMLEGYETPELSLGLQLEEIKAELDEAKTERQNYAAQSAEMTRRVLRAMLSEAQNGPRLFLLSPVDPVRRWDPRSVMHDELQLTLCCEHPNHEHYLEPEGQLRIRNVRAWVAQVAPYALLSLKVLRIALPVVIGLAEDTVRHQYEPALKFTDGWIKAAKEAKIEAKAKEFGERHDHLDYGSLSRAEGASLRAFHRLLAEAHGTWQPGDATIGPVKDSESVEPILRRVVDKKTGDVLWVCARHYKEYDPGLPIIPKQRTVGRY